VNVSSHSSKSGVVTVNVFKNHHKDLSDHMDDANIFDHGDTTSTIGV